MKRCNLWHTVIATYLCGRCTSRPVAAPPEQIVSVLQAGDSVLVTTHRGEAREFDVTRISANETCGQVEWVATRELARVQKREFSVIKTILLLIPIQFAAAALRMGR